MEIFLYPLEVKGFEVEDEAFDFEALEAEGFDFEAFEAKVFAFNVVAFEANDTICTSPLPLYPVMKFLAFEALDVYPITFEGFDLKAFEVFDFEALDC
ncbi:hypothetical protein Tco_0624615 [Tanacetum coccineum]|uniref:Uncharacterized protein n=1 Tax=Tanacetum coccineum TaxID=301880 RepID=A0ABQ4WEH6_9ASTR